MKKGFIVLLMAFLIVPIVATFNVNAATYEETNDGNYLGNNDYARAEYVDRSEFSNSTCYIYSTTYSCYKAQIEGYVDSGGDGLMDHYGFYIPYDTKLRITNSVTYSNGEYGYGLVTYKLYKVDEGFRHGKIYDERMPESSEISQDNITINQGIPVEAGYYVLVYDHNDNDHLKITRKEKVWFVTYNRTYHVDEYHFAISHMLESGDYIDTSKTIYESKLDSDSAAVWVNDNHYEDLYFTNSTAAGVEALQNDFEDYIGHNISKTVLDSRIYILSDDMLQFTRTYIKEFKNVLNKADKQYKENVADGVFGFGQWYTVLGMSESQGENVGFVVDQIKSKLIDGLALSNPAGLVIAGIDHLMANQIQDIWESHQYLLMVFAVKTALEMYPNVDLEAHPELFTSFYVTLNALFGNMIENPNDLDEAIEVLVYLEGALDAMSSTINADEDFMCYFDILVDYEYEAPAINKINYEEYTTPRLRKNYHLREFDNSNTKYLKILTGSVNQSSYLFTDVLKEDYIISESISYNGITYHGEVTYTSLYENTSTYNFNDVYVENNNSYTLSNATGTSEVMKFSRSYVSGDDDKLLDGIYALHPEFGFLEVQVEVSDRIFVSRYETSYKITTVYKYIVTYYVVNPHNGTRSEIEDFSGYITYNSYYIKDRNPIVKPPITIAPW